MEEGNSLLHKWEKQYGGIKNRQFYIQSDHNPDQWNTPGTGDKFSSIKYNSDRNYDADVREEIQEDPAEDYKFSQPLRKANKLEGSNTQKEFEYDWDEEESMSYLKKLTDKNLKENYNKYGQQSVKGQPPPPQVSLVIQRDRSTC